MEKQQKPSWFLWLLAVFMVLYLVLPPVARVWRDRLNWEMLTRSSPTNAVWNGDQELQRIRMMQGKIELRDRLAWIADIPHPIDPLKRLLRWWNPPVSTQKDWGLCW